LRMTVSTTRLAALITAVWSTTLVLVNKIACKLILNVVEMLSS
jgi:hypothetical protein